MIDDSTRREFQAVVWDYYRRHGRHDLPWRRNTGAYHILVSELMLQQTQVSRVIPKYTEFLGYFPTIQNLAAASLGDVLRAWNGLGYNRRAKFLWQAAGQIVQQYSGVLPQDRDALIKLPGIGGNTAGAILAYAYDQPIIFIETNIRTVFLHHFFHNKTNVSDKTILEYVAATLDTENPRKWYWALMDYGSYLKQTVGNLNAQSSSYSKQSAFHGSRRQIRGQILRLLDSRPHTEDELQKQIPDERLSSVLDDLAKEELICRRGRAYKL